MKSVALSSHRVRWRSSIVTLAACGQSAQDARRRFGRRVRRRRWSPSMARARSSRSAKRSRKNSRRPKRHQRHRGHLRHRRRLPEILPRRNRHRDASRPISATEVEACKKSGVEFIELPVAYDGIAIAVNPKALGRQDHRRGAEDALGARRAGQGHEVEPGPQGLAGSRDSPLRRRRRLGHLRLLHRGDQRQGQGQPRRLHVERRRQRAGAGHRQRRARARLRAVRLLRRATSDKLKLVPVDDGKADNGDGAIMPSPETIRTGTYQPLSRPVFIYVSKKAAERPEVQQFVEFYLKNADKLVREVELRRPGRRRLHDGRRSLRQADHRLGVLGRRTRSA